MMQQEDIQLNTPILQPLMEGWGELPPLTPQINVTSREFDEFFSKLYHFYYHKGLLPIILFELTGIINLFFIGALTGMLLFLDVGKLMACGRSDEATCAGNVRSYVNGKLHEFSPLHRLCTLGYIALFFLFFAYQLHKALITVLHAIYIDNFCHETLCCHPGEVETMQWNDIVAKIMRLHSEGKCLAIDSKTHIDELEIAGRIMRRHNYFIALINRDVLDLKVPWYFSLLLRADRVHLTVSLEWCLNYCLLDSIHNESLNLSSAFLMDRDGLSRKFILVGLINALLTPFTLVLMTMQFFLSNAQQTASTHMFARRWTSLALWKFREFNELPHIFEQRIVRAHQPASEFLEACQRNQNLQIIARCVQFLSGAFVALLLLCSVLREEALLYIHVGSHNLLWWLGLFTSIYVASRAYAKNQSDDAEQAATMGIRSFAFFYDVNLPRSRPDALIEKISAHTHYYPRSWRPPPHGGAARSMLVKDELESLFPHKLYIFLQELLSVVLTPIILCCSLPPCAPKIIAFVKQHSTYIPGMGAVVDYSLFDFDKYQPAVGVDGPFSQSCHSGAAAQVSAHPLTLPLHPRPP